MRDLGRGGTGILRCQDCAEVGVSEGPVGGSVHVPGYRIGRRIGRGGFAVVHEAEQLSLGRAVALKMLMPDRADESDLRRFERERLLLSDLSQHRHVVDVIDAGTASDGRPFLVMRLYRRGSLAQALADGGPLPPATVVDVVAKLASALQAAHNLGVIHRDVKPENVLVADDGEPALADFGISVLAGSGRTTGNLFTISHAAPEVLDRGEYGVPSDVYALASTAYTLLCGHPPFGGSNYFAQLRAILQDPVPPLGMAGVPPEVEAVVGRGLAKRPADRYPSAVALADALRGAWLAATTAAPAYPPPAYPPSGYAQPQPMQPAPMQPAPMQPAPMQPAPMPSAPMPSGYPPPGYAQPAPAPSAHTAPALAPPDATRQARGRRGRRVLAWGSVAALALTAGVVGGTYALDVPPGSMLTARHDKALPAITLAADFTDLGMPGGVNPTIRALQLYLDSIGGIVAGHPVTLKSYEIASPQHDKWDLTACKNAARAHVAAAAEVAVIGPYNSGCAKAMLPILGGDPATAITAVSNGSTDPGLTKAWGPGEPGIYRPGGVRTFARVVTTDDVQGRAAATFAAGDLHVRSVFVLQDGGVYGQHVAGAFADAARAAGIKVLGTVRWIPNAASNRDLFAKVAALAPDAVFLGGTVANGGLQLVADKVAVLGDNEKVRLLAPDGFAGEPRLARLPAAQGMYVTFPGLSPESIRRRGGAGSSFLDAYQRAFGGADPPDPYALYGVAAAQVVLEAVRQSDGTRRGVHDAIFSGAGVTVPKEVSVLGADTRIDPATGDVLIKDVTIDVLKRSQETLETTLTVP